MAERLLTLLTLFTFWNPVSRAGSEVPNINAVYSSTLHTILLHKDGFEMSAPVYPLNGDAKLKLSFDDFAPDLVSYKFTFRHCEADWTTTPDLLVSEYINGIPEDEVKNFEYSFNTTVKYIHYSTVFPTPVMQPKISGNYLLIVYVDDPAVPVFTMRFLVVESTPVTVTGEVVQPDAMADRYSRQQVNFTIQTEGLDLSAPRLEVKPVVIQNDRWDNAVNAGKPQFVRGTELEYSYDPRDVFDGGNEFRGFDMKSLRYQSDRIRRISYDTAIQVFLLEDPKRTSKSYIREPDINGRRLIKSDDNAQNDAIECDYAWVHFYLQYDPPVEGTHIYVFGALSYWNMAPPYELIYNPVNRRYEAVILLKQGFYNYYYVVKEPGSNLADETPIEGNHWETENQYMVLVYLRTLSGYYDRLVATGDINSAAQP